jgi:hypothetical protein
VTPHAPAARMRLYLAGDAWDVVPSSASAIKGKARTLIVARRIRLSESGGPRTDPRVLSATVGLVARRRAIAAHAAIGELLNARILRTAS